MRKTTFLAATALLGGMTLSAQAQYPAGYGGYGWHGWGAGADGGRTAAGMGVFANGAGNAAAGFGQRNVENSQARATNAQTAMGVNNYMWECQQRNNTLYWQRQARDQKRNNDDWNAIRERILNNPNEDDISNGSTLNAIYEEITNPKVYARMIDMAQKPVRSALIKKLPFQSAVGGFTYSLEELTNRQKIPAVYDRAEFANIRKSIRATVVELRKETADGKPPKAATVKQFRGELDQVKAILEGLGLAHEDTFEAEKYLKALYGLARMLDSPSYDVYLAGVDVEPSAPLCELLIFMHAFNLRFGAATDPDLREGYAQLYGMLSDLRQAVNPPADAVYNAATAPPPANDNRAANFYSNMSYQNLGAGGPAPPAARAQ